MRRPIPKFLVCLISFIFCTSFAVNSYAQSNINKWERLVLWAGTCLTEIQDTPANGIPKDLLNRCAAIAVFPGTTSAGFMIGGQYGSGIIMVRDKNSGHWSSPAVFDIAGGSSVGFQMGGENTDLIFLFMDSQSLHGVLQGSYKMGMDTQVLPGPVGLKTHAEQGNRLKNVIFSYCRSQGAFTGAQLSGAEITENQDANKALYGRDLPVASILGNKVSMPKSAESMIKALKTSI